MQKHQMSNSTRDLVELSILQQGIPYIYWPITWQIFLQWKKTMTQYIHTIDYRRGHARRGHMPTESQSDRYQQMDKNIMKNFKKPSTKYQIVKLEDEKLIAHNRKVLVPEALQDRLIDQYHKLLNHPGMTRMEATIRHVFKFRGLREKVEECCRTCHVCQLTKKQKKKYGHLPPKEAEDAIPWKRVNVDVIGRYTARTPKENEPCMH
jgi:hypothetical protein